MPEHDIKKVIIGDSTHMESLLNTSSVDLILTGPPYWNEVVYSNDSQQLSTRESYEDFLDDMHKVWRGCAYTLKPGGILAFWVHDFYRANQYIPFHADLIRQLPADLELKTILIWDRYLHRDRDHLPALPRGTRVQYIVIAQKRGQHPANARLIQKSLHHLYWHPVWSHKTTARFLGSKLAFRSLFYITRPFSKLLRTLRNKITTSPIISDDNTFSHYTTECPPDIAEMLIQRFSQHGDTILDPFVGSGTTLNVALKLKRQSIGIDINAQALTAIESKLGRDNYEVIQSKKEII